MKSYTLFLKTYLFLGLITFLVSTSVFADDDFKWEVGIGLAGITIPHYLGSDETRDLTLPLPYGIYEDEKTKVDREGYNYNLFGINDLDLSFSIVLGLPVDSEKNKARAGMPNLDTLLEVGPAVNYSLIKTESNELSLVLPLRGVFAFDDFSVGQRGVSGGVDLQYIHKFQEWEITGVYGINYADRTYHSQFYSVSTQYVTEDRKYYEAKSGISSHSFSLYLSRRWDDFYFGLYARKENIENAANVDSPLVKKTDNLYASLYFGWVFAGN